MAVWVKVGIVEGTFVSNRYGTIKIPTGLKVVSTDGSSISSSSLMAMVISPNA